MSAEQFPYLFVYPVFCQLCGTSIDQNFAQPMYREEMWRGYAQELTPANGTGTTKSQLVNPEVCPMTFLGEPKVVHSACWEVVKMMTGSSEFNELWLNGFMDCLADIAPSLPEIQFKHSPDLLDQDLTENLSHEDLIHVPNDRLGKPKGIDPNLPQLPGVAIPAIFAAVNRPLAGDIGNYILPALERGDSLPGSVPDTPESDDLQEWLMFGERIRFSSSFPNGPNNEIAAALRNAMRNIKTGGPARFPHTSNYNTVWKNAARVLARLGTIPVEQVGNGTPLNGKRARLQTGRTIDIASFRNGPPEIHLTFLPVSRQHYITHGNDRGMKLGMRYLHRISFTREPREEYDMTLRPDSFCGIRFIDDNVGVLAVHLKTRDGWEFGWQQDPDLQLRQSEMKISVSQAEWELGAGDGSFILVSDTEKDRKLVQE
ncbi:hypothetical protein FQN54_009947 [Arachnomyces sp. PD_36]|nr:hypothetical protein FQN54_009947 [Arachnomyces sp. PD_36]